MKTRTVQVRARSPLKLEALESRIMLSATTTALPVADAFPLVNNAQWTYADKESGQSEVGVANMSSTGANSYRLVENVSTHSSTVYLTSNSSGIFATSAQASGQGTLTFASGVEFLPSVLTPGETFGGQVSTNATLSGQYSGSLTGQTTSTGKVIGWTTVVTATGTYEAMHVTDKMSFTGSGTIAGFSGHGSVALSYDMYLVPGIGIVAGAREVSSSGSAAGHSASSKYQYTASLTSTNLPAPTGTDLTVQFGTSTLPTPSVPGDKGNVTVIVTNQGETPANGSMELDLYASTDQNPADGVLVTGGQLTGQAVNLADGQSQSYTFKNVLLPTVPAGTYYLLAVVNSTQSIPEANYANDTASATGQMAYEFGAVGARKNVVLNLADSNATLASFSLHGAGTGTVAIGANVWDLDVTGSTTASNVTITTRGGAGVISLRDVTVEGPLAGFTGKGVNLADSLTVDQQLKTLTLNDLTGHGTISIHGAATDKTTLTFNHVLDESVISYSTIASLTAAAWGNSGGVDSIAAPGLTAATIKNGGLAAILNIGAGGIGKLTVTGGPLSGSISAASVGTVTVTGGDLSGSITATASAVQLGKLNAIGKLTVTGGDITGNYTANGNVGAISAAANKTTGLGGNASGRFNFGGSLASLTLSGRMDNSRLVTAGSIKSVTVGGMQDSAVFAGVSSPADANGDGVLDLPGALADFSAAQAAIGTFTIKGLKTGTTPLDSFINSNIAAWKLNTLSLAYAQGGNGGWPFGVACNQYGKLSYRDASDMTTTWTRSDPTADLPGDGVVLVLTV